MVIKIGSGNEVSMVARPGITLEIRARGDEKCKACGRLLCQRPEQYPSVVHREFLRTCRICGTDQGLQERVHVS